MELIREQIIPADLQAVWNALNDDAVLKACIPGCESVERFEPDAIRAVVKIKVGPVGARFAGVVRFSDQQPPHGYKITFEGQGGAAGFAQGYATVALREHEPGSTVLAYEAHAQVGGRLAQIGSRLIDSVAAKTAEEFFVAFSRQLSPEPAEAAPAAAGARKPGARPAAAAAPVVAAVRAPSEAGVFTRADVAAIRSSLAIVAGCSVVATVLAAWYVLHAVL